MRKPRDRSRGAAFRAISLALAGAAVAALGAGCSLAGYATEFSKGEEELPTAVFSGYSHSVVEKGRTRLELEASVASVYEESKRIVLSGVTFTEFDIETGKVVSRGQADSAVYHNDTKDAEFSGNVRLESIKQDAVLQGEYLRWLDRDKRLEGRLDRRVTVSRSDGSEVSGAGFEADGKRRSFSFREGVDGVIKTSSSAEDEK